MADAVGGVNPNVDPSALAGADAAGSVSKSGSKYDGMSLADKIFMLMMSAAEEQESRVEERFNMIEGKNSDTATYNSVMEQLRTANGKLDPEKPDDTVDINKMKFTHPETGEEVKVADYLKDSGMEVPNDGKDLTKDQITGLMDTVKDKLDSNSSQSQTDIIKLQNENSKLNRIYELLSNFLKTHHQMVNSIVRNIGWFV